MLTKQEMARMIETRWEVKRGSLVTTTDGDYGHLKQLLLDPDQERIIGMLVQPRDALLYHPIVVPEHLIENASDKEVRLKISADQVKALPKYWSNAPLIVADEEYEVDDEIFAIRGKQKVEVIRAPGSTQSGTIESQLSGSKSKHLALRLHAGQFVFCGKECVGSTSLILLDANGGVKGFVLHTGRLPLSGRDLIVLVSLIEEADRDNVHLSIAKPDLDDLPAYYSDEVLGAAVDNALWADKILRNIDYKQIGISVEDGVVRLRGHVVTSTNKRNAEEAARSVAGVLSVENDLVVDEDLVLEVAQAFGKNDLTRSERIAVGARHGFITLNGEVGSPAVREAAEEIAASVPQVRGVVNYIHAPNLVIDYKDPIWQPYIGQEVYAADMQLGQVERVIINPHNRRVTSFVTRGYFPNPGDADGYRLPSDEPQDERSVVIPMSAVSGVTDSSVMLEVSGAEAALYRSFETTDFISAPTDWLPPYPYHRDQVSFEGQRSEESRNKNTSM
jgi:osmotically-inducible protein OsmY/sporulation protein YlmC with PRC-barrel domain